MRGAVGNGHARHQRSLIQRAAGLAHAAAHAGDQLAVGVLQRVKKAALVIARAHDAVEAELLPVLQHHAVEARKRHADVVVAVLRRIGADGSLRGAAQRDLLVQVTHRHLGRDRIGHQLIITGLAGGGQRQDGVAGSFGVQMQPHLLLLEGKRRIRGIRVKAQQLRVLRGAVDVGGNLA